MRPRRSEGPHAPAVTGPAADLLPLPLPSLFFRPSVLLSCAFRRSQAATCTKSAAKESQPMPRRPVLKPAVWPIPAFQETAKALQLASELATSRRPLSLITAPAGSGKTFAAEWYAEQNRSCKIAVCPPAYLLSARSLLEAVAGAIGYTETHWRVAALFDNLVAYTANRHIFLVLDEADRMNSRAADLLRELAEDADLALCFLGCPGTLATLARVPATHHRIGFRFEIPPVELADVARILDGRYDDATVEEIFEQTGGNLRHIEAVIALVDKAESGGRRATASPKLVRALAHRYLLKAVAA
jgi:DNA transposition AAA+ family ATPase